MLPARLSNLRSVTMSVSVSSSSSSTADLKAKVKAAAKEAATGLNIFDEPKIDRDHEGE